MQLIKNNRVKALVGSAMMALPLNGCYAGRSIPRESIATAEKSIAKAISVDTFKLSTPPESPLVKGLPRIIYPNLNGKRLETFDENALWALSNKFLDDSTISPQYSFPIDTSFKPYVAKEDIFGAAKGILPHTGIDISVNAAGAKTPIAILSPVNGVVVTQETPLKSLGLRKTKVMGEDGKIYSFEYLANANDYKAKNMPIFKKIGNYVKANDTLGLLTQAPKTDEFKLHMGVEDMGEEIEQLQNPTWQGLKEFFDIPINGSVNPLDSNKAGDISKVLNQYKVEKGTIMPIAKEL